MFLVIVQVECSYVLMFDCLFYSNSILVHNKVSLYKEMWVKKTHLHAKSGSLQGCPLEKFGSDKR